MRVFAGLVCSLVCAGACSLALLGCQKLDTGSGNGFEGGTSTDGGTKSAEAGIVGGNCGIEQKSGAELCVATSMCPKVVVDTQAMPSCGFRIRGATVDLVCACGASICPMGVFTSCAEAAQLLANQTEQSVCVQVAEGRCTDSASSGTTSSSSSGGNPACDRQCMKDCGGGAACSSICNCD